MKAGTRKTVIFDFGGVLVNDRSSDKVLSDAIGRLSLEDQAKHRELLQQSELGKIPYSDLLEADKLLFPDKNTNEIKEFFFNTEVYKPFRIAERLLRNHRVIIFSNNHVGAPEEVAKFLNINISQFPFINSALVGMRKPQKEFYDYLLEKYKLVAKNCVFIDNMFHNLIPAQQLGMKTFHYQQNDEDLVKFLNAEGIY